MACSGCQRFLNVERLGTIGQTPSDRFDRALELSKAQNIDLASASSVLLGIMSLAQARRDSSLERPLQAAPGAKVFCDLRFADAIAAGTLSVAQARQRGDRVHFASRVAARHSLPMDVAFRIADNELTVLMAVRRHRETKDAASADKEISFRIPRPPLHAVVLAGVVLVVTIGYAVRDLGQAPPLDPQERRLVTTVRASPTVRAALSVKTDPEGRPTEIVGSTPSAVLSAYCNALLDGSEPLRTVPSDGAWTGLFRDSTGTLKAIEIGRVTGDATAGWRAGDGASAIAVASAGSDLPG